ncbi:hypothetical protein V500_08299 [Pseudogymnoascus sp. VKM F-4518 (FW-2643)]|nr:hypothetical protein V500_08299 [Pseudogymnoascus sp. VKM F-4518 (FW-2643)]
MAGILNPFTPLSGPEIESAAKVIQAAQSVNAAIRFKGITLREPAKESMQKYLIDEKSGTLSYTLPRKAFVNYYVKGTNHFFEAIVNLDEESLERNIRVADGLHGPVDDGEVVNAPCDNPLYRWHSVEVISPALYFRPESLTQIRVACATITTQFRVVATRTTGLHVHVGDGENGFSVGTLRNLIALLWGFEPQLQTLHPSHRRTETWCMPLRIDTKYAWSHPKWTISTFLEDLFSSEFGTVEALVRVFDVCAGDRCAVEFSNLDDPMVAVKQTIEFRAHSGTLDGDEVVMWVKTVVGLVEWVRGADSDQLMSLMALAEAGNDEFGVTSLLEILGLREQAEFYKERLHPLRVAKEDSGREYEIQELARPRTDVLEEFGIGVDGVATRNNWGEDLIFDPDR